MFINLREKGRKGKSKRNIDWLPPICTLTSGGTGNLDICPNRESNPRPFGIQGDSPTNGATWLGLYKTFLNLHNDKGISEIFVHYVSKH